MGHTERAAPFTDLESGVKNIDCERRGVFCHLLPRVSGLYVCLMISCFTCRGALVYCMIYFPKRGFVTTLDWGELPRLRPRVGGAAQIIP